MAAPSLRTLKLDPILPDLSPAIGTEITVQFDRDVALIGTGLIASKDAVATYEVGRDGKFPTIDVPVNDDPNLQEWSVGFGIIVTFRPGSASNGRGVTGGPWTVLITSRAGTPVSLSHLDHQNVVNLPPGLSLSDVMTQVSAARSDAAQARSDIAGVAATAAQAAQDAADAKQLQQANSAAPDGQVAAFVTTDGTATKTALSAAFVGVDKVQLPRQTLARKPEFVLTFGTMPAPADVVMQGFAYESRRGDIYTTKAVGTDLYIYRMSPGGTMVSYCIVHGGPHGNNMTAETVGSDVYLYFCQTSPTGTNGKTGPVKFKYKGSATGLEVTSDDANFTALPDFNSGAAVNYSIDTVADRIAIFLYDDNSKTETIQLRKLSEFKAGTDNVLATISYATPQVSAGVNLDWQGVQTIDNTMYVWRGGAFNNGVPTLYVYDWTKPTAAPTIIDLNWMCLDYTFARQSLNEAEGLSIARDANGVPTLILGVSSGPTGARRNSLFSITPTAGVNPLQLKAARRAWNAEQGNELTVTPAAANTPTQVAVKFPWAFERKPAVVVTPDIDTPGAIKELGVTARAVDGFTVTLTRADTTPTVLSWVAREI